MIIQTCYILLEENEQKNSKCYYLCIYACFVHAQIIDGDNGPISIQ